jgi:predicted RNA methylase
MPAQDTLDKNGTKVTKKPGSRARGMVLRWALLKAFGPDRWQFASLLDSTRNYRIHSAISRQIAELKTSLGDFPSLADVGAGFGIHAILASKQGVKNSVRYERLIPVAKIELEIAKLNGASIKIKTNLPSDDSSSEDEQASAAAAFDLVVVDIWQPDLLGEMDVGLLGSGLMSALEGCRRSGVIGPKTRVIPQRARLLAALISLPQQPELVRCPISSVCGFDLSAFSRFCPAGAPEPAILDHLEHTLLTEPVEILDIDLQADSPPPTAHPAVLAAKVVRAGMCNAVVLWHELRLDGGSDWVSSGPGSGSRQSLQILPAPVPLQPGGPPASLLVHRRPAGVRVELTPPAGTEGGPGEAAAGAGECGADGGGAAAGRVVQRWHFGMLNDSERNDAYDAAIRAVVAAASAETRGPAAAGPAAAGPRVLDVGAGTGLLGMMAARAGASAVACVEKCAPIAAAAEEIVRANGFAPAAVRVICRHSTEVSVRGEAAAADGSGEASVEGDADDGVLEARADVMVSEVRSCYCCCSSCCHCCIFCAHAAAAAAATAIAAAAAAAAAAIAAAAAMPLSSLPLLSLPLLPLWWLSQPPPPPPPLRRRCFGLESL